MNIEQLQQSIPQSIQNVVNWGAVYTVVGVMAGWLPTIASLFTIVWLGLQIYSWVINKKWRRR